MIWFVAQSAVKSMDVADTLQQSSCTRMPYES